MVHSTVLFKNTFLGHFQNLDWIQMYVPIQNGF